MNEFVNIYEFSVNGSDVWYLTPLLILSTIGFELVYFIMKCYKHFPIFSQIILFFGWSLGIIASIMRLLFLVKVS